MKLSSLFKFKKSKNSFDSDLKKILQDVELNLFLELDKEVYCWCKSINIKKYECLILSKFLISYSLSIAYKDLDKNQSSLFFKKIDEIFIKLHEEQYSDFFSHKDMQNIIKEKYDLFYSYRKENKPPECWHLIYSHLTGKKNIKEIKYDILGLKKAIAALSSKAGSNELTLKFNDAIDKNLNKVESFDLAEILFRQNIRLIKKQLISLDIPKQLSSKK